MAASVAASLSSESVPCWSHIRHRFPRNRRLAGVTGRTSRYLELVYRSRHGKPLGVLQYQTGYRFIVVVDPQARRRGIATKLLRAALELWSLDLRNERYTEEGAAWMNAFLEDQA
mgnify:CR=1 FL=1